MVNHHFGNEFRVRARLTASLAFGMVLGIGVAGVLVATPLARNVTGVGLLAWDAGAALVVLIVLVAFREAIFRSTIVLATGHGLDIGKRKFQEPWDDVLALTIGTSGSSGLTLTVDRAGRGPVAIDYAESYDPPWPELFQYIREVAPRVRLIDQLRAARADRE